MTPPPPPELPQPKPHHQHTPDLQSQEKFEERALAGTSLPTNTAEGPRRYSEGDAFEHCLPHPFILKGLVLKLEVVVVVVVVMARECMQIEKAERKYADVRVSGKPHDATKQYTSFGSPWNDSTALAGPVCLSVWLPLSLSLCRYQSVITSSEVQTNLGDYRNTPAPAFVPQRTSISPQSRTGAPGPNLPSFAAPSSSSCR